MSWVTVGVMAAGAVAGKMKNDRARAVEDSDRKLASATQRYSPWTGMQANQIRNANSSFGDVFSGGLGGAMMGQSLSKGMAGFGKGAEGTTMAGGGLSDAESMQSMSPDDKLNFQMDPNNYGRRTV